jgi:hypothetical protein
MQPVETVLDVESALEDSGQIRSGKRPVLQENRVPPSEIHVTTAASFLWKLRRVILRSYDVL